MLLAAALAFGSCYFLEKSETNEDVQVMAAKGKATLALRVGAVEILLVRIPQGEFTMGSSESEEGHAPNESPVRRIRISRPFYLGQFEITRTQYRAVMRQAPGDSLDGMLPIQDITYANAVEFCRRLSDLTNVKVRLPTEAQWEYACRAGTQTRYWSGSADADLARVGWYDANSGGKAHPVGQKPPNPWGLYDMHGNAWEYCADAIDDYATMPSTDPVGSTHEHRGAIRGGGWMHGPDECRAATRMISDDMFGGAGFRIAVDEAPP